VENIASCQFLSAYRKVEVFSSDIRVISLICPCSSVQRYQNEPIARGCGRYQKTQGKYVAGSPIAVIIKSKNLD
jgi:hypothetical protein